MNHMISRRFEENKNRLILYKNLLIRERERERRKTKRDTDIYHYH